MRFRLWSKLKMSYNCHIMSSTIIVSTSSRCMLEYENWPTIMLKGVGTS